MKKKIALGSMVVIAIFPLIALFFLCFGLPVYAQTYYAALEKQYDRLLAQEGNKVVLVGGSNVAFGVDVALFESLYGAPLVPLGLYGVFGIRAMLELSKANLQEGDTVILCPELTADSFDISLRMEPLLKATETRPDILWCACASDADDAFKSLIPFALTKSEYLLRGERPQNEGVYRYEMVDAYGEIAPGSRPGNVMRTGYLTEPILSDISDVGEDFFNYVNEYAADCRARGVTVLFSFPPVNAAALSRQGIGEEQLYALYDGFSAALQCKVISDPVRYAYDYRYFYDTNFHLNDSGAVLRTVQLVRDLHLYEGENPMLSVELPPPPEPVVETVDIDPSLPYTDASLFLYEEENGYLIITGVREALYGADEIVLPVEHEGKYIVRLGAYALSACGSLRTVTVPVGITELSANCFDGCGQLTSIRILEDSGNDIAVYDGTFAGVHADCRILLVNGTKADFASDYFWGRVTLPIEEVRE